MFATNSAEAVEGNTVFPSTAISDAFETVTNGMHNPEAIERLYAEKDKSSEWINLIEAIRAFYRQDFESMNSFLRSVPDESIAAGLKNVLVHMSGTAPERRKLSFFEEKLAKRVTEDSRFLASAIEQLNESIEYGGELFIETATLLIKEIKKSQEAAERLTLWTYRICIENGFDDETLADNILVIFGQAEGLRLIALSLAESEPESSLICFIRSLIRKIIDRTAAKNEVTAYLEIIGALLGTCDEDSPVILDISEMLSMLESELCGFFSIDRPPHHKKPGQRVDEMIKALTIEPQEKYKPGPNKRDTSHEVRHKQAVQLELF